MPQSENDRKKIFPMTDDTSAIKARIEYLNAYGKGTFSNRMDEIKVLRYYAWREKRDEQKRIGPVCSDSPGPTQGT